MRTDEMLAVQSIHDELMDRIRALEVAISRAIPALLRAANLLDDVGLDDAEREAWEAHQALCDAMLHTHEQRETTDGKEIKEG